MLEPQTKTKSPAPELSAEPSPASPSTADKQQTDAETEDAAANRTDEDVAAQPKEKSGRGKEETREQEKLDESPERNIEEAAGVAEVGELEVDVELEEETEKVQPAGRDVEDSILLSEKERQNEEMNEKDNCSASSISSTSSTLEREERDEKITNDMKAGTTAA